MKHSAIASPNQMLADIDASDIDLTPQVRGRRRLNRRNMLIAQGLSYIFDASLLGLYVLAGSTSLATPVAYLVCGLTMTLVFMVSSETGLNDRFKDHYLTILQNLVSTAIMLGGIYLAPEVGFVFCLVMFIVFSFSTLRTGALQAGIVWTFATVGLTAILLLTDKQVSMPVNTWAERVTTLLVIITVLGRCIFTGLFAVSVREALYKRSRQLKQAYDRIEELAQIDELTGALNRRFAMMEIEQELVRAQRAGRPCSVALIDLDWFKRINDTHGHPAGDEALRTFAITVFANIRAVDKFGRYGGEEFLLILPETPQDVAASTVERLRRLVAELDWTAICPGMQVTVSAGVTSIRSDDTTDSLLSRVDDAMYRAKNSGRNRICES